MANGGGFVLTGPVRDFDNQVTRPYDPDSGSLEIAAPNGAVIIAPIAGLVVAVSASSVAISLRLGDQAYRVIVGNLRLVSVPVGTQLATEQVIGEAGGNITLALRQVLDPTPRLAADAVEVRPTVNNLRLRAAPVNGTVIGTVTTNDVLESLEGRAVTLQKVGVNGQWLNVRTAAGQVGYVAAWFVRLEPLPPVTPKPLVLRPLQDNVQVLARPINGALVETIGTADLVTSLESEANTRRKLGVPFEWLNVQLATQKTGYTLAEFLGVEGEIAPPPPPPATTPITGVNLDILHPLGKPAADRMQGLGWVRLLYNVSFNPDNGTFGNTDLGPVHDRYRPVIEAYANAGLKVLLVFTHQTYGEGQPGFPLWEQMTSQDWQTLSTTFAGIVGQIAQFYAANGDIVHAYQIWNEQDAPVGSPASVSVPPSDYGFMLTASINAIKAVAPNVPVLTGGHNSGPGNGRNYAQATFAAMPGGVRPDGIAIHPYGRGPDPGSPYANFGHIDDEINAYTSLLPNTPVWFTEWGVLDRDFDPPSAIAQYATEFVTHLKTNQPGKVAAAIWYAWAQGMDNGYGLVNSSDQPRQPLYDQFLAVGAPVTGGRAGGSGRIAGGDTRLR
ncbi:MAG: SH3 domain-containing protein [Chloroflexi bacterium]|nr:SH3 domain-containing protein [Chloroflexota bacterium]